MCSGPANAASVFDVILFSRDILITQRTCRTHAVRASLAAALVTSLTTALTPALRAEAQTFDAPTGVAIVDSANVARASFRAANKALAKDSLAEARRLIARAHRAWPTHASYAWGVAYTDGLAGDTVALLATLRAYAALGLGRDLHTDTLFSRFLGKRDFADVALQHDENRAHLKRSAFIARMRDSTTFPEGIDFDARTGSYYIGSVRHRNIIELRADGTEHYVLATGQSNVAAILGVRVDAVHRVLWATTSPIPQTAGYTAADSVAALLRIRMSDGVIEARYNLPASPNGHTLGDLAIGSEGDVFMTDSNEPFLYRLKPGASALTRTTSPLFRNLQGVAPANGGTSVYVADYLHGLLRVDLSSGSVLRLVDAPNSTSLGCDGIIVYNGSIIAVQNGVMPARVMRFVLSADGNAIIRAEVFDRDTEIATEPTIGTLARGSFVYVANSQWDEYDAKGQLATGARLRRPVLLGVRLGW